MLSQILLAAPRSTFLLILLVVKAASSTQLDQVSGHCIANTAGHSSRALLQVKHRQQTSTHSLYLQESHRLGLSGVAPKVEICAVQDNRCFDMSLQSQDVNRTAETEDLFEVPQMPAPENKKGFESKGDTIKASDLKLVVTRLTEDIRWLDALPQFPTLVFNRGPFDSLLPTPRPNLEIVKQANEGREDEVMLKYIIDDYDNLSNVTIFLQGWPFTHCPGIIETIGPTAVSMLASRSSELSTAMTSLLDTGRSGLVPLSKSFWQYSVEKGQLGLAVAMVQDHHHASFPGSSVEFARNLYSYTCRSITGGECPDLQWVAEGAQWAVSRERIRSRPKELYQNALKLGEGFETKYRGLVLEALWPHLWQEKDWDPSKVSEVQLTTWAGQARQHALAQHHCHIQNAKSPGILWSCDNRFAVCEFNRHVQGSAFKEEGKSLFLQTRNRYTVTDFSMRSHWSMMATVVPSLRESVTFASTTTMQSFNRKLVENSYGEVQLEPVTNDIPMTELQFNISQSRKGIMYHFVIQPSHEAGHLKPRYLGCNRAGFAALLSEPYEWDVHFVFDGWTQLNSDLGQLHLRRRDNGRLKCLPAIKGNVYDSAFLINAVKKSF
jgi:hypothetical protein